MLLTRLLEWRYDLTLNGTLFSDGTVIKEHIDVRITLTDAVNFQVDKNELFILIAEGLIGRSNHPIFAR